MFQILNVSSFLPDTCLIDYNNILEGNSDVISPIVSYHQNRLDFPEAVEPEIKFSTSESSLRNVTNSTERSISVLSIMLRPLIASDIRSCGELFSMTTRKAV